LFKKGETGMGAGIGAQESRRVALKDGKSLGVRPMRGGDGRNCEKVYWRGVTGPRREERWSGRDGVRVPKGGGKGK